MRSLAIVHQRDAGPGVFADACAERSVTLEQWFVEDEAKPPRDPESYDAVLTFGGAANADQEERHSWLRPEKALLGDLLDDGIPILGVCLGAQLLAEAAGALPHRAARPEIGWSEIDLTEEGRGDPVIGGLGERACGFQWHSYEFPLPPDAVALARSETCLQAFRAGPRAWGIQFHAEVSAQDAARWIRDYRTDEDAIRIGLDPDALGEQTRERIGAWNQVGRALCGRFLEVSQRIR